MLTHMLVENEFHNFVVIYLIKYMSSFSFSLPFLYLSLAFPSISFSSLSFFLNNSVLNPLGGAQQFRCVSIIGWGL